MTGDFDRFYRDLKRTFGGRLLLTSSFAAGVSVAAVGLLGLSGWFLTGAAVAGAAGPVIAQGFNYLLPAALIRFLAIARTTLRYGERYLGHETALNASAKLRPALFERLLNTPAPALMRLRQGETALRLVQDVGTLENGLVAQSAPPAAFAGMVTAIILAGLASPWPALILLFFLGLCLSGALLIHRFAPTSEAAALGALQGRFQELLTILPDIRTLDPRQAFVQELEHLENRLLAAKVNTVSKEALSAAWVTVLTGIALAAIAAVSLGEPLMDIALALLSASMGFESLSALVKAIGQGSNLSEAHGRVAQLYEPSPSEANTPVSDLTLQPGERVRIDGPSGSGKTRLAESLMGLRGGDNARERFAFAPQDAAFLTGTIRHNLLMADPAAKDEALWTALDDAGLSARIQALPKQLDSWIGDGGITLSGGERKRLCLARAYLRDAPFLLLDEPTEGLDRTTEAFVIKRLEERLDRTGQGLILISHREAPRRLAAKVVTVTHDLR